MAASGRLLRVALAVQLAIGAVIVASGITYFARGTVVEIPDTGSLFRRVHDVITDRVTGLVNGFGIMGLGAVHGFLPCPLLYPAFLYAFARGSVVEGALSLAVLGAGTFPTLMVYGLTVRSVGPRHRRMLHRVLGVVSPTSVLAVTYLLHALVVVRTKETTPGDEQLFSKLEASLGVDVRDVLGRLR